jgi:putative membrane protein
MAALISVKAGVSYRESFGGQSISFVQGRRPAGRFCASSDGVAFLFLAHAKENVVTDLWLAIFHHILVFGLAIMLGAQAVLVRQGMSGADAVRVARLDIGYGITSGLIIFVGIARVIYGAKGYLYYVENVWFWAKMTTFALIGLSSIKPTLRFRAWQRAQQTDPRFAPPPEEVRSVRSLVLLEVRMLAAVVAFAATMARYTSF